MASDVTTIESLLRDATAELSKSSSARLDAEVLLANMLDVDRSALYRDNDRCIAVSEARRFRNVVSRRRVGQPVAQLTGKTEFWSLPLAVDGNVLIPRPETELLVTAVVAFCDSARVDAAADLGTGTAAIAIACATERDDVRWLAADRSIAALAVAERNVRTHECGDRVALVASNWLDALADDSFDVIVSNPPYVESDDPLLESSDIRFEPRTALVAGRDGLSALREIIAGAPRCLRRGGRLIVEHGFNQGARVRELFAAANFTDIESLTDHNHLERVTRGTYVGS